MIFSERSFGSDASLFFDSSSLIGSENRFEVPFIGCEIRSSPLFSSTAR
jgi:hypothetical protein